MLRIKPVQEENASEDIKRVYEDTKATLQSPVVPLLFQYIANFPEYFTYQWGKIKTNIQTDYFSTAVESILQFTKKEVGDIYSPSSHMAQFTHRLHADEKLQIQQTIRDLQLLNAKLLLITIALREGVKGVIIGQEQLKIDTKAYEVDIFDLFHTKYDSENHEIEPASKMLAPLFGTQAITITHYPEFFSRVAGEMDHLIKQENYLWKRVELERVGMRSAMGFPYSFGTSYHEIVTYAGHRPHLNELIYILAETFPSQFPRLLITTTVMDIALLGKSSLATT